MYSQDSCARVGTQVACAPMVGLGILHLDLSPQLATAKVRATVLTTSGKGFHFCQRLQTVGGDQTPGCTSLKAPPEDQYTRCYAFASQKRIVCLPTLQKMQQHRGMWAGLPGVVGKMMRNVLVIDLADAAAPTFGYSDDAVFGVLKATGDSGSPNFCGYFGWYGSGCSTQACLVVGGVTIVCGGSELDQRLYHTIITVRPGQPVRAKTHDHPLPWRNGGNFYIPFYGDAAAKSGKYAKEKLNLAPQRQILSGASYFSLAVSLRTASGS